MHPHAVRIVAERHVGVGQEVGSLTRVERCQSAPPSVDSKTPPPDSPRYMWFGSRGSMMIEWSIDPSGVPSTSGHSAQVDQCGWSFQPLTGVHVSPRSSVRNKPCGDAPDEPAAGLVVRARRQPEHRAYGPTVRVACLERRRLGRLRPRRPAVGRPHHRRPEMPGSSSDQHPLRFTGIGHHVLDDVAEHRRLGQRPVVAVSAAGGQHPRTLASTDPQRHAPCVGRSGRRLEHCHRSSRIRVCPTTNLAKWV